MEKFDELKYWMNFNVYVKTALIMEGLGVVVLAVMPLINDNLLRSLSSITAILLALVGLMQLVLGTRQMIIDYRLRKNYWARYRKRRHQ